MKCFKDFINEADNDFDVYAFDSNIEKALKLTGIGMTHITYTGAFDASNHDYLSGGIDNNRKLIKDRFVDVKETRYYYGFEIEFKHNKFEFDLTKEWYEKASYKKSKIAKVFSSEKDCLNFLVQYVKSEANAGCFDKGRFIHKDER